MSIFGHGFESTYEPSFSGGFHISDAKTTWSIDDAQKLSKDAFDKAMITLYTCNAATPPNGSSKTNLVQELAKSTGSTVTGWSGQTTYNYLFNPKKDTFIEDLKTQVNIGMNSLFNPLNTNAFTWQGDIMGVISDRISSSFNPEINKSDNLPKGAEGSTKVTLDGSK